VKFSRSEVEATLERGQKTLITIDGIYGDKNVRIRGFNNIEVK
jgi:hypothetical protein